MLTHRPPSSERKAVRGLKVELQPSGDVHHSAQSGSDIVCGKGFNLMLQVKKTLIGQCLAVILHSDDQFLFRLLFMPHLQNAAADLFLQGILEGIFNQGL